MNSTLYSRCVSDTRDSTRPLRDVYRLRWEPSRREPNVDPSNKGPGISTTSGTKRGRSLVRPSSQHVDLYGVVGMRQPRNPS